MLNLVLFFVSVVFIFGFLAIRVGVKNLIGVFSNIYVFSGILTLFFMRIFYLFMFNALDVRFLIIFLSPIIYIMTRYIIWHFDNNKKYHFFNLTLSRDIFFVILLTVLSLFISDLIIQVIILIPVHIGLLLLTLSDAFTVKDYMMSDSPGGEKYHLPDKVPTKNTILYSERRGEHTLNNPGSSGSSSTANKSSATHTPSDVNIPNYTHRRFLGLISLHETYTPNEQEIQAGLPNNFSDFEAFKSKCNEVIDKAKNSTRICSNVTVRLNYFKAKYGINFELVGDNVYILSNGELSSTNTKSIQLMLEKQNEVTGKNWNIEKEQLKRLQAIFRENFPNATGKNTEGGSLNYSLNYRVKATEKAIMLNKNNWTK